MYKQRHNARYRRGNRFNQRRHKSRSFDPRTVIGKETNSYQDDYEVKNKFSDFPLNGKLARNVMDRKYPSPTPIQDQAIPEIMSGRDVVGVANTGTGKTAAFIIPLIEKVVRDRKCKVLIITPTRELAVQIDKEFQSFSRGLGIYSTVCIVGVSIKGQINKLQRGSQFVIGTPGRLLDLENQGKIDFYRFDSIVLDEVDRMLDMGFIHDVNKIISKLPKNRQSLFFSATLDA